VYAHYIAQPKTNGRFVALSSDSSKLDGLNIHVAILDEVHAWSDRTLFEVIESGIGKRDQSLMFMITTSGYDTQNICYEIRSFVANVLSGNVRDDSTFGLIYTIDEGDDWMSEDSWRKANPNWGVSVMPEVVRASALKAQVTPAAQAGFKTKHLNIWAAAGRAWMQQDAWDACSDPQLSIDEVRHFPCYIGVDLASKIDINAVLRVFYDEENGRKYTFTKFYLPSEAVETSKNALLYRDWAERGHITITDGNIADLQMVEDDIDMMCSEVDDVRAIGFDPYQATQMMTRLMNKGLPVVEVRPTKLNLSEPMKQVEADVMSHTIAHDGNPVMSWMVSNITFKIDARDNMYPNKDSIDQKIDGGLALMTAYNRLMAEQQVDRAPTIFAV
jgi:phage terminase large subunit-like protein